jgi:hypothetical protein
VNRESEASSGESDATPPENFLQMRLVGLWASLLQRRPVGIDDDFFQMGGTVQTCERMFAACGDFLGEAVRPGDVSGKLSVRSLASFLAERLEARASGGVRAASQPSRASDPQDALQDRLADLCERLLGRPKVGIDDDLFGLGGTPESAQRIFAAIEELYGERLAEDDLPAGRITVRGMSNALAARVPPTRVMQVQAGAPDVPPLFVCHGEIGGGGYYVRDLARALGQDQPVYVFSLHGMHGEDIPPSIEAIAADHVEALTLVSAGGPVYLGGLCISAIVAYEMARQLTAQRRQVVCSFLIEPLFASDRRGLSWLPPPWLSPEARRLPAVRVPWLLALYRSILRKYEYGPYSGKVSVFWASGSRPPLDGPETRAMVQALAPNVEFHTCPGTHHSTLGRNNSILGAAIRASLRGRTTST